MKQARALAPYVTVALLGLLVIHASTRGKEDRQRKAQRAQLEAELATYSAENASQVFDVGRTLDGLRWQDTAEARRRAEYEEQARVRQQALDLVPEGALDLLGLGNVL